MPHSIAQWLRGALARAERAALRRSKAITRRPIFIVSLPRSGSTLFYLLLLQRFRLCYFSNLMARLPDSPVVVGRLTRRLGGGSPPPQLDNHFGNTRGWAAPNQGWQLFNRWLPADLDYIDPASLDAAAVDEMRATIAGLQACFGAPFASKWQRHAARLRALAAAFPEALFVHLRRSPVLTAQSILAGRREFLGDERAWLSARPRHYDAIKDLTPVEQVCEQVCGLDRDIAEDRALIGEDRFFTATYEEFCTSPESVFTGLATWYQDRAGEALESRRLSLPRLEPRSSRKVGDDEWQQIMRTIDAIHSRPGRS
jgi:hypothetical protein